MKWEEAKKQFRAEKTKATKQKTIEKLAELESDKNIQHLKMRDKNTMHFNSNNHFLK
jgi:hypothetical protein